MKQRSNADGQSNRLLWILLGGGALTFLLCGCGGVGVGAFFWLRKPDNALNKALDNSPVAPAVVGKSAWGSARLAELDPEIPVWDMAFRLPKNFRNTMNNEPVRASRETFHYQWHRIGGFASVNLSKVRTPNPIEPRLIYMNTDKFKSGPNDAIHWDTIRMPQVIEINGLKGARKWVWMAQDPKVGGKVTVFYHFHLDGWDYTFQNEAAGATREAAENMASLVDVSACTFRKR